MVNNLYNPITFETSLILYPPHCHCEAQKRLYPFCHCEEQSDEAISLRLPRLPFREASQWQWGFCHCEERSNEAIAILSF